MFSKLLIFMCKNSKMCNVLIAIKPLLTQLPHVSKELSCDDYAMNGALASSVGEAALFLGQTAESGWIRKNDPDRK